MGLGPHSGGAHDFDADRPRRDDRWPAQPAISGRTGVKSDDRFRRMGIGYVRAVGSRVTSRGVEFRRSESEIIKTDRDEPRIANGKCATRVKAHVGRLAAKLAGHGRRYVDARGGGRPVGHLADIPALRGKPQPNREGERNRDDPNERISLHGGVLSRDVRLCKPKSSRTGAGTESRRSPLHRRRSDSRTACDGSDSDRG